ncbi:response regulator [Dactylosporangium sp. NPDC005555]|uniref:response regulator n=1 Tax=Dactylosporangium sp. NPDC005555 TaxID=3154889 RepID=UPI0033A45613
MALTLAEGSNILVADDDPRDAQSVRRPLEDAGFRTAAVSDFSKFVDADEFLRSLIEEFDALVCDHVLSGRGPASFTGAEVVSKANKMERPLPAVLISSHVNTDQTGSIRQWRAGIPAVVDKSDYSDTIVEALDYTIAELSGKVARERRTFATPIEVLDVRSAGEFPAARVVVVGWKIETTVWMPLKPILDAGIDPAGLSGRWLEAEVNCHAKDAADLYYENVVLAPDLPQGWM